jgi:hypothetical protein
MQKEARQFLQMYYQMYDGDNREAMAVAYHNNAVLSITSTCSTTCPK